MQQRLNARDVARYRSRLKRFYEVLFNHYDPGIPVRAAIGDREIPLKERFVLPEIFGSATNEGREQEPQASSSSSINADGTVRYASSPAAISGLRARYDADRWAGQSQRSVILGGPGSGKSAFLRALVIELLSDEPIFPQAAQRWGGKLPIWIPFSYWTSLNAKKDSPLSLPECLSIWFRQFDQFELWPLVQSAMDDERLLLLVDGLDEWTDETAARTTGTQLQSFIQIRNLSAILVSRPHGFERVSVLGADWQVGRLAPLSRTQQRELIAKWLIIHRSHVVENNQEKSPLSSSPGSGSVDREVEEFIGKLERSKDLAQLAEVPLTLLLLLYLHLQNTPLPTNRFDAYEHVVKHFIQEHPLSRKTAAASTSDTAALTYEEMRYALADIAYVVQTKYPAGVMTLDEINENLESFLRDDADCGLGLTRKEALEVMRSFTNVEEGSLGLLVSQGQSQVSFFHRSLQEYLAAVHLSRTTRSSQIETITTNLSDPRWREVLVGLIFLCQRGEDASALIDSIENVDTDTVGTFAKEDILAEVAFRSNNLPPSYAKKLMSQAFAVIETSPISSQRSRVLGHAMSGLHSRRNRSTIQERLKRWTFSRGLWGAGRVGGLSLWPPSTHTWETLYRLFHDEDSSVIREAVIVASNLFSGVPSSGDAIAHLAFWSENPYCRAACVEALAKTRPQHPMLNTVLDAGRTCDSEEVRVATVLSRVHLNLHDDDDFNQLILMSRDGFQNYFQYEWSELIPDIFARGWSGDVRLKQECLKGIDHQFNHPEFIERTIAQVVLLKAFPQDDEVADFIARELKKEYAFNSSRREIWPLLPTNFRDHPKVVAALDEWALAHEYRDVIALHFGSLVGRTTTMQKRLFQAVDYFNPFWAVDSLLAGWGMGDADVAAKLTERISKPDASEVAQHIPAILREPQVARSRLFELLRDKKSRRIDFLLAGFERLTQQGDIDEIVDATIDRFSDSWLKANYVGSLILAFPLNPKVKALARENLHSQSPFMAALVESAATDEELRNDVAELITPLPVDLRYQIVLDLPVFADQSFATKLLSEWDAEHNAEVKTQASIQYHSLILQTEHDVAAVRDALMSTLPCYGPDHEERRQAAGAGLIVLKQLEAVVGKIETIGHEGKQINIAVTDGYRQNRVFSNLLGKNWSYVKAAIGDRWEILEDRMNPSELWERLGAVAADYPKLAKDILERADMDWTLKRSASVLTLLSRFEIKSETLLNTCIAVLSDKAQWYHWYDSVETASDILADQFRGNLDVQKRILGLTSEHSVPTNAVMPLSLGWPDTPLLRQLHFKLDPNDVSAAELYTKYAIIASKDLPNVLESDLAWARRHKYRVTMMSKPLLARLRYDSAAAAEAFDYLKCSGNPTIKASVPKLLAAAGKMTVVRAEWCRQEIERQQASVSPEIGYDITVTVPRSVVSCLLESIGETPTGGTVAAPES